MCLLVLLLVFGPRIALVVTWFFTNLVDRAFESVLVPALAFLFLPWTTLAYAIVYSAGGLSGLDWVVVAIALFIDLSSFGVSARTSMG